MRRLARTLVLAALGPALAVCGDAGTAMLPLSWQFADGRRCDDAGAFTVSARSGDRVLLDFPCEAGLAPQSATLPSVSAAGLDLELLALSAAGDELYRGHVHLDAIPPSTTITLYA